jgi:hypothetical protein
MQVVNFSITLPDQKHPATQVHMYGSGIRELTVEIPAETLPDAANQTHEGLLSNEQAAARRAQDEYVLGGYAGI